MGEIVFLDGPRLYRYEGWDFEVHGYHGPWPLRQDGELRARAGRKFWGMWTRFEKEADREQFRVGGGCCCVRSGA